MKPIALEVLRPAAVVTHHEDVVVGHLLRPELSATATAVDHLGIEVRLDQLGAVDEHDAVADLDRFALQGDDPLDQVARSVGRALELVEHDDVATIGIVQSVRQLVDEDPVAVVQRGVHRVAVDDEVREHERAHEEGDEQRHPDDDDPVDEPACPAAGQARPGLLLAVVGVVDIDGDVVGIANDQLGIGERFGATRVHVVGHVVGCSTGSRSVSRPARHGS